MNFRTAAKKKRQTVGYAQAAFDNRVTKTESVLFREFLLFLSSLRVGASGYQNSIQNIKHVLKLVAFFDLWMNDSGIAETVIRGTTRIMNWNERYFKIIRPDLDLIIPEQINRKKFLSLGYDNLNGEVVRNGYIDLLRKPSQVKQRLVQMTMSAVSTNIDPDQFQNRVKKYVKGEKGKSGALEKTLMPSGGNAFSGIDRGIGTQYAEALRLNYALWNNSPKLTTTDFCRERFGNLYSRSEIESWNELPDWQGRIPDARVEEVGHGYNCRTSIDWISEEMAELLIASGEELNKYNTIVLG